jgi:hypothetical protein
VYERLNHVTEAIRGMAGECRARKETLSLIHEHLLNQSSGGDHS